MTATGIGVVVQKRGDRQALTTSPIENAVSELK